MRRAHRRGLISDRAEASIDATGLEIRHVSSYYGGRRADRGDPRRHRWPKLTAVSLNESHLIIAAAVTMGPSNDSPVLAAIMPDAARRVDLDRLLADAGYDAERNHALCREELAIRSTVIPLNPRGNRGPPQTRYRGQMHRRFHGRIYGQRWQVESVFSRNKRILGSALRARREDTQADECLLRTLTHNVLILRRLGGDLSTEHSWLLALSGAGSGAVQRVGPLAASGTELCTAATGCQELRAKSQEPRAKS